MGPGAPLNWANVVNESDIVNAVYVIGYRYSDDTTTWYGMVGTGFAAYYSNAIWTNAHVVEGLRDRLTELSFRDPEPVAVRAGTRLGRSGTYQITGNGWTHPEYVSDDQVYSEDIGLFEIAGTVPVDLSLLPQEYIDDLQIGQPVGTLGFPGELSITGDNADFRATPTFKDGTISGLRRYDGGVTSHVQVQYDFDVTGGTSGSPVFDHNGWVIAVNFGTHGREISGVFVGLGSLNQGIRVDEVWEAIGIVGRRTGLARAPSTPHDPSATYLPFPENWNGETILPHIILRD